MVTVLDAGEGAEARAAVAGVGSAFLGARHLETFGATISVICACIRLVECDLTVFAAGKPMLTTRSR
jgi:hypothetical protein